MLPRLLCTGLVLFAGPLLCGCTSCCHRPAPVPVAVGAAPACPSCGPAGVSPVPPAPVPVNPAYYPPGSYAPRY